MSETVFIFVALYPEAKPFIQYLQLKREKTPCGFEVYCQNNTGLRLVITGCGMVAAAAAVGSCLAYYGADTGTLLFNIGSCAGICGNEADGKLFLCNKITDRVSGRTFYPDIWYQHGLAEAELWTVPQVIERGSPFHRDLPPNGEWELGKNLSFGTFLCDMEAAAVYQAASYYIGPHQMCFLKIISDAGEGRAVTAEMLTAFMEENIDRIMGHIEWLEKTAFNNVMEGMAGVGAPAADSGAGQPEKKQRTAFDDRWQKDVERLCAELHSSQTMRAAVEQCARYWTLAGIDYQKIVRRMREQGMLPCRDKREGKQRFEELKKQLL